MLEARIEEAIAYKRSLRNLFMSIAKEDIQSRVAGDKLHVTVKMDGEFNLLYFDGVQTTLINRSGRCKTGLPVLARLTEHFRGQSLDSVTAGVELHVGDRHTRSRIGPTMRAVAGSPDELTVTAFDLLEVDGVSQRETDFPERIGTLQKIFGEEHVVEFATISSAALPALFARKVEEEGHEGLIIRSADFPFIYKLKPLYSLDLAIIGYTLSEGTLRSLLVASMDEEGSFVQLGHVGNGLDTQQRAALQETLAANHVASSYIEVDSRRVAFQLVRPTVVVDVLVNELLIEDSRGYRRNPRLTYCAEEGFSLRSIGHGVSLLHPVIHQIREDKSAVQVDIPHSQVTDLVILEEDSYTDLSALPSGEIIFREVYTKPYRGMTSIKKFVAFKTHKEETGRFPAYVFQHTDFSPSRKDPLKKTVRISSCPDQIKQMCADSIASQIKKGWTLHS